MKKFFQDNGLYIGLAIALAGMLGSLYFSEVMGLAPCLLCWYQRIALYPLVAIFAIGIIRKDQNSWSYAFPFIIAGVILAAYHVALVQGFVAEPIASCAVGVPCAQVSWSLLGFITIPFLSFLAFVMLGILRFVAKK